MGCDGVVVGIGYCCRWAGEAGGWYCASRHVDTGVLWFMYLEGK
jgi:hypothetical protein